MYHASHWMIETINCYHLKVDWGKCYGEKCLFSNAKCALDFVFGCLVLGSLLSRSASENLLKIFRPKLFAFIEEFLFLTQKSSGASSSSFSRRAM
jgi:hypothetical protein